MYQTSIMLLLIHDAVDTKTINKHIFAIFKLFKPRSSQLKLFDLNVKIEHQKFKYKNYHIVFKTVHIIKP